jgi:hypothetical protein
MSQRFLPSACLLLVNHALAVSLQWFLWRGESCHPMRSCYGAPSLPQRQALDVTSQLPTTVNAIRATSNHSRVPRSLRSVLAHVWLRPLVGGVTNAEPPSVRQLEQHPEYANLSDNSIWGRAALYKRRRPVTALRRLSLLPQSALAELSHLRYGGVGPNHVAIWLERSTPIQEEEG